MKIQLSKIAIMTLVVIGLACTDDSLDPFRLKEIKKGSILALRGDGDSEANFFFKDNIQSTDAFSYEAEFLSENQELLSEVQVYARILTGPRVLVATVPGTSFTIPSGGKFRAGTVTVPLADILAGLSITDPTTLERTDLVIESDIILSDGTSVPASAIVNDGLFQSSIFFPAQVLGYRAETQADFLPKATTKTISGLALKAGAKDTVLITYDQTITNVPTATAGAGVTLNGVVEKYKGSSKVWFQLITADAGVTSGVTVTIKGATSVVNGVTLTQLDKKQTVNVDNTAPQVTKVSTGSRIGQGGITTISVTFNEKMNNKSANAIKVTITGQNLADVTDASMTLSSSGLVATYTYVFKLANVAVPATHGPLSLTFTGGADESGNPLPNGSITGSLICDVGEPPAPTLTLDGGGHDLGTQIKWSAMQTTGGSNPGGSTTGSIYFVAIPYTGNPLVAGTPPTAFAVDSDGVATWTVAGATVVQTFANAIQVDTGVSGTVFSAFTPNGSFDFYAVFVSNTGNISPITGSPQLSGVVMN